MLEETPDEANPNEEDETLENVQVVDDTNPSPMSPPNGDENQKTESQPLTENQVLTLNVTQHWHRAII
ncbi:hypothetical protein F2Q70_00031570 [Brassica cretica]|uniref:Uncharacterized protein n=1 Tax=Brassica cretica TaxID=69181 RepID=A0A8S9FJ06_BRACR|nr:hypothetical protein F2Q70_00031570 [Brassica cretica]